MITVVEYLQRKGREYPKPDAPDGSISDKAFARAGVPMVMHCTTCYMTFVLTEDRLVDPDTGAVYCSEECAP